MENPTRHDTDPDSIGALGICASGGYVPYAAQTDHRVMAVATVSAVDLGPVFREGLGRTQEPAILQAMLDQAGAARTTQARGAHPQSAAWIPDDAEELLETGTKQFRETFEFYRTPRGYHPRAIRGWVPRSVDQLAQYDSYAMIELISPRPLLMIAGSEAESACFSREAIEQAAEPKELFVLDGATHMDLYDKDEYVTLAVAKLTEFYGRHLADQLITDFSDWQSRIGKAEITATSMADGTKELLDEAATSMVTGEEEPCSHTDLVDFTANIEGAQKASELLLKAVGQENDTALVTELDHRFARPNAMFDKYRVDRTSYGFTSYDKLGEADRRQLSDAVNALAEPLSRLAATIAK
ncbi:imelysin family protein [Streptomyces sp. YKOK-I1]